MKNGMEDFSQFRGQARNRHCNRGLAPINESRAVCPVCGHFAKNEGVTWNDGPTAYTT
jgi:hypothetical protein